MPSASFVYLLVYGYPQLQLPLYCNASQQVFHLSCSLLSYHFINMPNDLE